VPLAGWFCEFGDLRRLETDDLSRNALASRCDLVESVTKIPQAITRCVPVHMGVGESEPAGESFLDRCGVGPKSRECAGGAPQLRGAGAFSRGLEPR